MTHRSWFKLVSTLILFFMITIGLIVYIIDPYQQYRKASLYKFAYQKERYMNAGIAKNFDYDAVIIGSSMTENFLMEDVNTILGFKRAMKLSVSGATSREEHLTLQTAINHSSSLKNVLFGLDIYTFNTEPLETKGKTIFPEYLYDYNYLNDGQYLFNIDILKESINSIWRSIIKEKSAHAFSYNTMYEWQPNYPDSVFGKEILIKQWNDSKNKYHVSFKRENHTFEFLKKSIDKNLLNIIKNNKEIKFIIFYPPYSMYAYKEMQKNGWLQDYIEAKKYIFDELYSYSNVEIHDLQIANDIIKNFDNYKDFTHYHQKINHLILNKIKYNKYLLSQDNYSGFNNKFVRNVNSFNPSKKD